MHSVTEESRQDVSKDTQARKKSRLGQFFTPERIARFMADLFTADRLAHCRLLDAGAGVGSLSAAFLDRWVDGTFRFDRVDLDVFEIDRALHTRLRETLDRYRGRPGFSARIREDDFIHASAASLSGDLFSHPLVRYTHAILNPPYRKLSSVSAHRLALRRVGIETVNLYSAFIALTVVQMEVGGQIVAIIPRSFCNGPYYRPFREYLLERAAIRHLHLFESRRKAFKADDVLQENIIILLDRGGVQGEVMVSTSTDDTFADLVQHAYPFDRIVRPDDPERFIHVPASPERNAIDVAAVIRYTLADLGIKVSTGPVVDFRVRAHLRDAPDTGTVPLLYPCHFPDQRTIWPIDGMKKPNAIVRNDDTERLLFPNGCYCVVRRFSSKEERHRIVASVVKPCSFGNAPKLGFENHLNVFHDNKHGLPEPLAHGLALFLNSTAVDDAFRCFNGHTQVNATDLRLMKFPSRSALLDLGQWAMRQGTVTQERIDEQLDALIR